MELKNKIALITGSAQGIGLAIAEKFCSEGAIVFICDINEEAGEKAIRKLRENGGMANFLKLDVSSDVNWKSVISTILETEKSLDILVNNAGINIRKTIEEISSEEFDAMCRVNIKGSFLGIKHALPIFKEKKSGSIINMSSICGLVGHKYTQEAYSTTKGAVTLLTKSVASRYGQYNIRCNSIHPSTADTPLVQDMLKDPLKRKERLDEVPLGRIATLQDIAEAALYLASERAAFLNGVSLPVDGGVTAY